MAIANRCSNSIQLRERIRVNKLLWDSLSPIYASVEHSIKHANTIRPGDKRQCSTPVLELRVNRIPITIASFAAFGKMVILKFIMHSRLNLNIILTRHLHELIALRELTARRICIALWFGGDRQWKARLVK